MNQAKVDVVEMEAAALYSFSKSKNKMVICFAHTLIAWPKEKYQCKLY
jgi:purine-nucleoside phosphorylase